MYNLFWPEQEKKIIPIIAKVLKTLPLQEKVRWLPKLRSRKLGSFRLVSFTDNFIHTDRWRGRERVTWIYLGVYYILSHFPLSFPPFFFFFFCRRLPAWKKEKISLTWRRLWYKMLDFLVTRNCLNGMCKGVRFI